MIDNPAALVKSAGRQRGTLMISIIFPGQGAHYAGMGAALSQTSPAARSIYQAASDCLGLDLLDLTAEQLSQTRFAQPAIVTCSLACLAALREQAGRLPDDTSLAGFSLGEYTALGAAGILDLPDLLHLVQARADFMQQAARQNPGAMAAVIGLDDEAIAAVLTEPAWSGRVFAVNFNAPGQVVLSGELNVMDDCLAACRAAGARKTVPLDVSGAFHTSLMQPAADQLAAYARKRNFKPTASRLYSNLSGTRSPDIIDWPDTWPATCADRSSGPPKSARWPTTEQPVSWSPGPAKCCAAWFAGFCPARSPSRSMCRMAWSRRFVC